MRAVLCGVLLAAAVGCEVKKKPEEPAPNVKLDRPEPGPGVDLSPPQPPPKSMLKLDYAALWRKHAPGEAASEGGNFLALIQYVVQPEAFLAAELAGGGPAGPLAAAARVRAQPEVMKKVEAAAAKPPAITLPLGGSMFDATSAGLGGGNRKLILGVRGTPKELEPALFRFAREVQGVAHGLGANPVSGGGGNLPYPKQQLNYKLPERSGTFKASLLLPDAKGDVVDELFPPSDALARAILQTREKDQTLLVVTVEEK